MNNSNLYEVRCPNTLQTKKGQFTCNTLCGKITGDSMGEFWCRKCKTTFTYILTEDGEVSYFNYDKTPIIINRTEEDKLISLVNHSK